MLTFAYYLLKVTLCSAIMYSYYLVALRNKRFHQYNRWYLLSAVCLSFFVPIIKIEFWKETVQPSPVMKVITIVSDADVYVAKNVPSFWSWDNMALTAFGLVSLAFLLLTVSALLKIVFLVKKHPKKFLDKICFVFSNTPGTPFSFFHYIFWNTDIDVDSNTGRHILKHELAHVEEKHSGDKLFINLALVIGWYNPFLWFIRKELNLIHEFIADQKAINNGDAHAFAEMLIKVSYPSQSFSFANSFFHSPIKRRLLMLTSSNNIRFTYLRRVAVLPLLAFITMLFVFNSKKVKASPHNEANDSFSVVEEVDELQDPNDSTKTLKNKTQSDSRVIKNVPSTSKDGERITINASKVYIDSIKSANKALVIIDGRTSTWEELKELSPGNIKEVSVLKGESAMSKYRESCTNGVIEVTTNAAYKTSPQQQNLLEEQVKSEIDLALSKQIAASNDSVAQFPGGLKEWRRFVFRNTNYEALNEHPAPNGRYVVVVSFVVGKDGSISNVSAETKAGYGTEQEAIRVISSGRTWQPAKRNEVFVDTPVKQTMVYTVIENRWGIVEITSITVGDLKTNYVVPQAL